MENSLLLDLYELTMGQAYLAYKKDTLATFDLFVRQLPANRNYLVACGLEDILTYIRELRFSRADLDYLRGLKLFSRSFLGYLEAFRFRGDIWAMPEGTVAFAKEPLLRVTASIIEAQIIEACLLNTVNLQTMIASKASRIVTQAGGRGLFDFSLRRTHGPEAGVKVSRSSHIAGFGGTSCVLAGKTYGIPVAGTMAHSFVMSFKDERESFRAYSETFPGRTILLVDTYNTCKGIEHAIGAGLQLEKRGFRMQGIRLDSGDIAGLSRTARRMLDNAGLEYVKIFATGNLDEFKIKELLRKGACVDSFGVGTNMGVSIDAPCLDVIYKLSEVTDENGGFLPVMKLSKAKHTYPGRKQVFRIRDKRGNYLRDVIALESEQPAGLPLLVKVVEKGKIIYKTPHLDKIRLSVTAQLGHFHKALRAIDKKYVYPVVISSGLEGLRRKLSGRLKKQR